MRAYKGLVRRGVVLLPEGADLPDGAVVTVTVGEAELIRARLRLLVKHNFRRSKARPRRPAGATS